MAKNILILVAVFLLFLFGCASPIPILRPGEPAPKITLGMSRAEVLTILGPPDHEMALGEGTLYFYCMDSPSDASQKMCNPVSFRGDTVDLVGNTTSDAWPLTLVRRKLAEDRKNRPAETIRSIEAAEPKQVDGITEVTLVAQKSDAFRPGDTVYVSFYPNLVRSVPMRSAPSDASEILRVLCIGSELGVLAVSPPWLHVKGADSAVSGWVLERWVTPDRRAKIDAEKRRSALAPEIARLEAKVKPIPRWKWRENLQLYEKLLELDPCNPEYQRKVDEYQSYGRKQRKGR